MSLSYGSGRWVAMRNDLATVTSTNGTEWLPGFESRPRRFLFGAAVGENRLLAVGIDLTNGLKTSFVYASTNGVDWSVQQLPNHPFSLRPSIAFGNGRFVALDQNGPGLISTNAGKEWTTVALPFSAAHVSFGMGSFFAYGLASSPRGEGLYLSNDGGNWSAVALPGNRTLTLLASSDELAVGIDSQGAVFVSHNGVVWTSANRTVRLLGGALAYGRGRFIAMDWTRAWISTNGLDWEAFPHSLDRPVLQVAYGLGGFLAVSSDRRLGWSADGTSWSKVYLSIEPSSAAFFAGSFNVVGAAGSLLQSDPVGPLLFDPRTSDSKIQFQFQFVGRPNGIYRIESSTNLLNWQGVSELSTNQETFSSPPIPFTSARQRFFRVVER